MHVHSSMIITRCVTKTTLFYENGTGNSFIRKHAQTIPDQLKNNGTCPGAVQLVEFFDYSIQRNTNFKFKQYPTPVNKTTRKTITQIHS